MRRLLKDPFTHFLLLGAFIYWLYGSVTNHGVLSRQNEVYVSRAQVLNYMQYKAKLFDEERFSDYLSSLSDAQRKLLVDNFIEDEILYKEALRLGLDQGDFIIKQRLASKVRFLLEDSASQTQPRDNDLEAYFKENINRYVQPASITFTHIFFDKSIRGKDKASQDAINALHIMNEGKESQDRLGDRFPFLINYADRTQRYVADHFGESMSEKILSLTPNEKKWQGPFESNYGYHIILLYDIKSERVPSIDEIRPQLTSDFLQEKQDAALRDSIKEVKSRYHIRVDADI